MGASGRVTMMRSLIRLERAGAPQHKFRQDLHDSGTGTQIAISFASADPPPFRLQASIMRSPLHRNPSVTARRNHRHARTERSAEGNQRRRGVVGNMVPKLASVVRGFGMALQMEQGMDQLGESEKVRECWDVCKLFYLSSHKVGPGFRHSSEHFVHIIPSHNVVVFLKRGFLLLILFTIIKTTIFIFV
jgi:hypothetical protein